MIPTITVSGFGAAYTIRLSPGHRPEMMKTSQGNSATLAEAVEAALLRMRAENGGTIGSVVAELRERGYDVLLDNVDLEQTAEDVERGGPREASGIADVIAAFLARHPGVPQAELARLLEPDDPSFKNTLSRWKLGLQEPRHPGTIRLAIEAIDRRLSERT